MLPQCSHITRKRGVYYYRRRLPRPHDGEVALSLRTKHFREAEHLAMVLDHSFGKAIDVVTDAPNLQAILREYLREALEADLEGHCDTPPGKPVYAVRVDKDQEPVEADLEIVDLLLSDAREDLATRRVPKTAAKEADALMKAHGLPEYQRTALALGILRARVQVFEKSRERLFGAVEPIELEPPLAEQQVSQQEGPTQPAAHSGPPLSELLPNFIEFMVTAGGWRGQTRAQNETTYRMFMEVCGDKPVQAYTRRDATTFYDLLRKLPALWSKKQDWREMKLAGIVEATSGQDVQRITMKTVKRHFSALGRLFAYFKRRGEYEGENPGHGFEFPMKGRASEKRQMWQGQKLVKLFSSPVWTGCHSDARRSRPGDAIIKDERYWLPILGLYHGNRLEEFAQLRREDIRHEEGIWYFDINEVGDKQLKNDQSVRRVPVHPKVIGLGFMEYLETTAPNPDDPVFPLLRPGGPDNKRGYFFTKWWSQYRKTIGVYEKGLDYHSFRHGVTTKLYTAGVPEDRIDELTGHLGGGMSRRVYKKPEFTPLKALHDDIAKVEWPEVDLS